jgi:hypothetical protein
MDLSIGITTYKFRFDKYLKPLINQIRKQTQNEIILAVNGEYKEPFDNEYRKQLLNFCAETSNVYPFLYPNFRSLAKMWNNIIVNATSNNVLVLNDDIIIDNKVFWTEIESLMEQYEGHIIEGIHLSAFIIRKDKMNAKSWFDERLLGIGAEDWEWRRRKRNGIVQFTSVPKIKGWNNFSDKQECIKNQRPNTKYSRFNLEVYNKNYPVTEQYPHEEFYRNHYYKL